MALRWCSFIWERKLPKHDSLERENSVVAKIKNWAWNSRWIYKLSLRKIVTWQWRLSLTLGRQISFYQALKGDIDIYPEFTGPHALLPLPLTTQRSSRLWCVMVRGKTICQTHGYQKHLCDCCSERLKREIIWKTIFDSRVQDKLKLVSRWNLNDREDATMTSISLWTTLPWLPWMAPPRGNPTRQYSNNRCLFNTGEISSQYT